MNILVINAGSSSLASAAESRDRRPCWPPFTSPWLQQRLPSRNHHSASGRTGAGRLEAHCGCRFRC